MVAKERLATQGLIPSLDGLRTVAILIVIWGHAELPTIIKASTGVTIFFYLSGYLITTLLRREGEKHGAISLQGFYLRRILRIFPPLYVVLLAAVALSLTGAIANKMTGWGALSSGTFLANYFIIFGSREAMPGGMNALWSLAVEEHYYLIFPLLYMAMLRWLPRRLHQALVLAAICLAIMGWRIYLTLHGASFDRLYLSSDTRADAILWGSVLAIIANPAMGDLRDLGGLRWKWAWMLLLVVSCAVFYGVSLTQQTFDMSVGYTIEALALTGVFVPLILFPDCFVGRILNWRPIAYVGVLSYGLYLVHRPILMLAEHLTLPHPVRAMIGIFGAFLAAFLLRIGVEKPFEKIRKRFRS